MKDEGSEQTVNIRKLYLHPSYDSKSNDNDIALVRLEEPLTFNEEVKSICVPASDTKTPQGKQCSIAGWGARKFLGQPKTPLFHVMPVLISNTKCNSSSAYNGRITGQMLCARGADSCQGDGGSSLTCVYDEKHVVVGLASWGNGCASPGKYGVYTDVRKYLTWIKYVTEKD